MNQLTPHLTITSCPACAATTFKIINAKPVVSKFQNLLVQCISCKEIIGVVQNDDTEMLMRDMKNIIPSPIRDDSRK